MIYVTVAPVQFSNGTEFAFFNSTPQSGKEKTREFLLETQAGVLAETAPYDRRRRAMRAHWC
jgi:hypothetical protein